GGISAGRRSVVFAGAADQELVLDLGGVAAHRPLDLAGDVRVVLQELPHVVATLTDALRIVGEPGAGLLDHSGLHAQIDVLAELGDPLAVHDVELYLAERRGDLVLDHLHPDVVADNLVAHLDRAGAADVQAHRGVELQRVAARGGLRAAVHHADLHADLVDENDQGAGLGD